MSGWVGGGGVGGHLPQADGREGPPISMGSRCEEWGPRHHQCQDNCHPEVYHLRTLDPTSQDSLPRDSFPHNPSSHTRNCPSSAPHREQQHNTTTPLASTHTPQRQEYPVTPCPHSGASCQGLSTGPSATITSVSVANLRNPAGSSPPTHKQSSTTSCTGQGATYSSNVCDSDNSDGRSAGVGSRHTGPGPQSSVGKDNTDNTDKPDTDNVSGGRSVRCCVDKTVRPFSECTNCGQAGTQHKRSGVLYDSDDPGRPHSTPTESEAKWWCRETTRKVVSKPPSYLVPSTNTATPAHPKLRRSSNLISALNKWSFGRHSGSSRADSASSSSSRGTRSSGSRSSGGSSICGSRSSGSSVYYSCSSGCSSISDSQADCPSHTLTNRDSSASNYSTGYDDVFCYEGRNSRSSIDLSDRRGKIFHLGDGRSGHPILLRYQRSICENFDIDNQTPFDGEAQHERISRRNAILGHNFEKRYSADAFVGKDPHKKERKLRYSADTILTKGFCSKKEQNRKEGSFCRKSDCKCGSLLQRDYRTKEAQGGFRATVDKDFQTETEQAKETPVEFALISNEFSAKRSNPALERLSISADSSPALRCKLQYDERTKMDLKAFGSADIMLSSSTEVSTSEVRLGSASAPELLSSDNAMTTETALCQNPSSSSSESSLSDLPLAFAVSPLLSATAQTADFLATASQTSQPWAPPQAAAATGEASSPDGRVPPLLKALVHTTQDMARTVRSPHSCGYFTDLDAIIQASAEEQLWEQQQRRYLY